jgi:opacity protein-like surface antigen
MKSFVFAAVAAAAMATPAFAATTVYNSAPGEGWNYGSGNNYTPANTAVLTTDAGDQLYLRWHKRLEVAPASVGDTYSFALGTQPLSFDWGFDFNTGARGAQVESASITIKNIGTGQSVSYNPLFAGNDNTMFTGNVQNSAHLGFAFLSGVGFDANVDGLYRVTLDVNGFSGGPQSLSVDAKYGAGVAAVPEPATWAMMIAGFGFVGGAMRRRTRTRTSITYA